MKYIFLSFLFLVAAAAHAQKYALLDERFTEPVRYSNTVTSEDKFNNLFPVEKKKLPEFLNALNEISKKLSSKDSFTTVPQYEIGCVKFTGRVVSLAVGQRIDYVITSTCDRMKISMHLCNAKSSNAVNAFFIKTWIKYIEDNEN